VDTFRIQPLTENDIRTVVESCGGVVAHPDAHLRTQRGGDFIIEGAVIELKILDEDGLLKSERQVKLAKLFRDEGFTAPVVVLDRKNLSEEGKRAYDRIIEGPIKNAVASARQQLKQTRTERPETTLSVLWVLNNGYTALNHEELTALVAHRTRNDTSNIDGVIAGGCYFHSDGFDSFFLWPLEYVPLRLEGFPGFDPLHAAWHSLAESFMSRVVTGDLGRDPFKGPVVDTQFEIDQITYVKPAPPIGGASNFFPRGRPRKNSTGLTECPPVALTFPGLSQTEWTKFHQALPDEFELRDGYEAWLRHEQEAREEGLPLRPFVRVPITFDGWQDWCTKQKCSPGMSSIYHHANAVFQDCIQGIISSAREMKEGSLLPANYILAVTDEIGQDKANDLSHIAKIRERFEGKSDIKSIVEDLRIFHEHAIALASAYAVAEGLDAVMWTRKLRYAWA
jgi:hypothetical protein